MRRAAGVIGKKNRGDLPRAVRAGVGPGRRLPSTCAADVKQLRASTEGVSIRERQRTDEQPASRIGNFIRWMRAEKQRA